MLSPDQAAIIALRGEAAARIARFLRRRQLRQAAAATLLGVPQPTVSKIMNGRVSDLSLELLLRIALRVGLTVVVRTDRRVRRSGRSDGSHSKLALEAREAQLEAMRRLTPEQRLNAFLTHCELTAALSRAGQSLR